MTKHFHLVALASACALGVTATAAELERGRLMRAPDHDNEFPKWAYGAGGKSGIFNSADEIPAGWEDHPSKVGTELSDGVQTPIASANGSVSEEQASKSTDAISDTIVDPAITSRAGVGGDGRTPATGDTANQPTGQASGNTAEIDAHGHPFDANLHAATRSKTKDGLWRMKVGVKRPAPAKGYPLDL